MALPMGEEGGALVSALEVVEEEEVMVVSAGGRVFRVPMTQVPEQHRRSWGKRIADLPVGDRVAEVTRAPGSGGKGEGPIGRGIGSGEEGGEGEEREQMELLS